MSEVRCEREDELLDALGRGYVNAELTAHIDVCAACTELRLVAGALLDDRAGAIAEAHVPTSAAMWYRMQLRSRQDAALRSRRSLLIGQTATLLIAISLIAAFFGSDVASAVRHLGAAIRLSTPLLLAIATWMVAAPVLGVIAVRQK
jgi:hypothetical protein